MEDDTLGLTDCAGKRLGQRRGQFAASGFGLTTKRRESQKGSRVNQKERNDGGRRTPEDVGLRRCVAVLPS